MRRPGFHHTPRHASRLNMAEPELSVLSRQCLSRRVADAETLAGEVAAREGRRNGMRSKINWCFDPADARVKLSHPYPVQQNETSVSGHYDGIAGNRRVRLRCGPDRGRERDDRHFLHGLAERLLPLGVDGHQVGVALGEPPMSTDLQFVLAVN